MASLRQNTWNLDQWYDQNVAGNVSYEGDTQLWVMGNNPSDYPLDEAIPSSPNSWRSSPVQLSGKWVNGTNAGGGSAATWAIRNDGSVWVWGKAAPGAGTLGLNQPGPTKVSSPKQVMAAPSTGYVTRVSGNESTAMAVQDGKLWGWGANPGGIMGQNVGPAPSGIDGYSSPTQIGTESTWSKNFAVSQNHALAVKTDGTLWVWGGTSTSSNYGQLGQGNKTHNYYSSPTQIGTDTDWSTEPNSIDVNYAAGCVKSTGELFLWGRNGDQGVLGQAESGGQDANSRSSPIQLPGTTWKSININYNMSAAVKTDGSLWTWGSNAWGQLGLNQQGNHTTGQSYSSPKQIPGTTWSNMWTSGEICWAVKTDGTLWSWGHNETTSWIGQNSQVSLSSPAQIGTDTTWSPTANNSISAYRSMLYKNV